MTGSGSVMASFVFTVLVLVPTLLDLTLPDPTPTSFKLVGEVSMETLLDSTKSTISLDYTRQ